MDMRRLATERERPFKRIYLARFLSWTSMRNLEMIHRLTSIGYPPKYDGDISDLNHLLYSAEPRQPAASLCGDYQEIRPDFQV